MIHRIGSYVNTFGLLSAFSISMFVLMMTFAFDHSNLNAFAQNQSLPFSDIYSDQVLGKINDKDHLAEMNFSKPVDVYSKDGVLKTTLVADYKIGKVDNETTTAMVYNGSLVGPAFHVYPGDRVEIDLVNNLNESTNLHFHGLHVSPGNTSDNIFLDVQPGKTLHYILDIPKDHEPGTNWYHSHLHMLSYGQVSGGLSGLFIIEGLEELLPEPLQNITHQTIAIKDFPFDNLWVTTHDLSNTMSGHESLTVNGEVNPTINITSGETQLWRLANIGSENEYIIKLPGNTFHVIAEDGSPVWEVWNNDSLFFPSGKRFDVLVTANGSGFLPLGVPPNPFTAPYDSHVATVNIQGNQTNEKPADILPTSLIPRSDLSNATIAEHRVLNFSSNDRDYIYKINNRTFDANRTDFKPKLGTVEEWKLVNLDKISSGNIHPFHIHINDFQVMSVNGQPYNAHGLQDTVMIPTEGNVVIRIPFDDFVGKSVFHCHLMFHGDFGMMGIFEVVK
jgi:FtsP/CotA-like multicopper oxidase with cupredoxin domain